MARWTARSDVGRDARCARPPHGPGGRARRRRGRRPPARPCGGRSASRGCDRRPAGRRCCPRRRRSARGCRVVAPRAAPARSPSIGGPRGTSYDAAPGRRPVTGRVVRAVRRGRRVPARALPYHRPMPPEPTHEQPLARNRDFKVLLTSQAVSSLGDGVSFAALPLLVLALTGSAFAMGVVGAIQTLPDLFFGMIAGAIADRSDRKRMMFVADLGRAGLTALIPLSVALDGPTMAVIVIVTAPMAVLPVVLPGRLHRVGARARRSEPDRARELVLRGHLLARLHHRAGHRRPAGGVHRPGADARDRRGVIPGVEPRDRARPARPAGARSSERPRPCSPTSAKGSPTSPAARRCAARSRSGPSPRSSCRRS